MFVRAGGKDHLKIKHVSGFIHTLAVGVIILQVKSDKFALPPGQIRDHLPALGIAGGIGQRRNRGVCIKSGVVLTVGSKIIAPKADIKVTINLRMDITKGSPAA